MNRQDNVDVAGEKWAFDEDVAKCFPDMLKRSIPAYESMRNLVFSIGRNYVKKNTHICDIGCSDGQAIEPFIKYFGMNNYYDLLDVSEPMLKKCRERFQDWKKTQIVDVRNYDIKNGIPRFSNSLVLSILTLQFTPIEYRHKIVQSVYDSLMPGCAFILVEKVLGNTSAIDEILVKEYYNMKKENSYSQKQIADKRKSLEGVLVPITAKWNENLLKECGFRQIDCFWRCLNFAGWIAIK